MKRSHANCKKNNNAEMNKRELKRKSRLKRNNKREKLRLNKKGYSKPNKLE